MAKRIVSIGLGVVLGFGLLASQGGAEWWEVWKKPEKVQTKAQAKKPEATAKKSTAKSVKKANDPAKQLLDEGDALYAQGANYGTMTKAIAKYQELVDTYPESPSAFTALTRIAYCYVLISKYHKPEEKREWNEKTIEIEKKIIEKYPTGTQSLHCYFLIGITYLEAEEPNNAEPWLLKAIEKSSGTQSTIEAELALVNCYQDQGRYQEALDKINHLIATYPDHNGVKYYHWQYIAGFCYEGLRRYDEAIEIYKNTLIKGDPRVFPSPFPEELTLYIGELYEEKGDYANAKIWYRKVIDDYPNSGVDDDAEEKLEELADKGKRGKK